MNLAYIRRNAVVAGPLVYRPVFTPVDYCGTLVYNATLHLIDGSPIHHSSLELPEGGDADALCDGVVALMQKSAAESGLRPRCDYLDPALTKAWRALRGLAQPVWAVSACLAGERCRYDGGENRCAKAAELIESGAGVPVCPELSGGLGCPRTPCERRGDAVLDRGGDDRTRAFRAGARRACRTAAELGLQNALLKEKSPSCGARKIYDGSFSGRVIPGEGIAAAALREAGLTLYTEEDFT